MLKSFLLIITCFLPLSLLSQATIGKPWTFQGGASTLLFTNKPSINLRLVSPRFKWSNYELTEEEEKHPEEFRNTRLMIELLYSPPLSVFCAGFNVQSRLLRYKRLSLDITGGLKFFFVPGPDYINIKYLKNGREIWYMNMGLLLQLDLGMLLPFAEAGGDGIFTFGTEVNLHKIYKKPKKRYNLHTRKA